MEKEKNNKGLIIFLIGVIVVLAILCILFAAGIISFNKSDTYEDNNVTESNDNNNEDDRVTEYKKTLFENITEIRNSDDSKENKAKKISVLFNEIADGKEEITCALVDNSYNCNEYYYDNELEQLYYGQRYFDLKDKTKVDYIQNYITYLRYKELYDKNMISKDVLENMDNYCIGYSYDDEYFYFDYYTGTYNKALWYAFDAMTGKCDLQNQKYSHSYQIDRKTLNSMKIVK